MELHNMFSGKDLMVAQRIQRRRLQILVHSAIYYIFNDNIVSDITWSHWGLELVELQKKYPDIAEKVVYADAFRNWDASTGFNLPINDEWVLSKAQYLLRLHSQN